MKICTKQYIREVISRNTKTKVSFGDDDILLLGEISPVEFSGALIEIQRTYDIPIYDDSILGTDLETINAIYHYVLHRQKSQTNISDVLCTNKTEGGK